MLQQQSVTLLHLFRMPPEQVVLLVLGLACLAHSVVRIFYTKNFYFWCERRKYAEPLEPSNFNLYRMRAIGVLEMIMGGFFAYIGWAVH